MRRTSYVLLALGVCLTWSSPTRGESEHPQAVSPGSAAVSRQLAGSCPTFSWSGTLGAHGYELVVYQVGESGELETLLQIEMPPGATSWTPAASECPVSGSRYAWAVRALNEKGAGPWSTALLFETPGGPSETQVRDALQVLRRYRQHETSAVSTVAAEPEIAQPTDVETASDPSDSRDKDASRASKRLKAEEQRRRERLQQAPLSADTMGRGSGREGLSRGVDSDLIVDGGLEVATHVKWTGSYWLGSTEDGAFMHLVGGPAYGNTAFGGHAAESLTPGAGNSFAGSRNSAFGQDALQYATTGYSNSAFGLKALHKTTSGDFNVAVGTSAMEKNVTGRGSTAVGYWALREGTAPVTATAIGHLALRHNSTGSGNSGVGAFALRSNTTGSRNSALGVSALDYNSDGEDNVAVGHYALYYNVSGDDNTAVGRQALYYNTASSNTAVGSGGMYANTTGHSNSALGVDVLLSNDTGYRNVAVGRYALGRNTSGHDNTAIGYKAGQNLTIGHYNIHIGVGSSGLAGETGFIRIGGQNKQTAAFIEGVRGATGASAFDQAVCTNSFEQMGPCAAPLSSARFKQSIQEMGETASAVTALRPVTFRYRPEVPHATDELQYGLIAEEVAEVFPTLVTFDDEGRPYTVKYELLTPLLLNEVQRQQKELIALRGVQREVAVLHQEMADRDREMADLQARLEKLAKKKRFRSD